MIVMAATPFHPASSTGAVEKKVVTAERDLADHFGRAVGTGFWPEPRGEGWPYKGVPFLPLKNRIPMLAGITYQFLFPGRRP